MDYPVAQPSVLTIDTILQQLRTHLPSLRKRYQIDRLGVFGSYVRGEQRRTSDLDLLVEFTQTPTLLELASLQNELSHILGVKKVDLVLRRNLRPLLSERILAEVVYP